MKIISSYAHGVLDYIVGIALLLAPNIFGFNEVGGAAVLVPRILGVIILLQAVMTRYELGLAKVIPFHLHLIMDYVIGLFLAASPWLFGFSNLPNNAWVPHVVVGIFIFLSTLMTRTYPERRHLAHDHPM